ncbi:hypothetical protein [Sphingomonas xanthus]|uniref:Lipoprotein n=1 Tax=Sphingomonas xanthus TaxID=2594473 RepID=A0A516IT55_9SPHN|nr:hypothetical protein [Sphingomonas xanthus]QDP20014.1 hypothetical protein FMM02_08630 [Sphingomonas xanthus]
MRTLILLAALAATASCSMPSAGPEPSLAPRPAEAIDPRLPVASSEPVGATDPALIARLAELTGRAGEGVERFSALEANASRLAAAAGPEGGESWIAAQQALSRLIEQFGVTTRAGADIDALAGEQLGTKRWISPADQAAISQASASVAALADRQSVAIDRIRGRLAR